MPLYEYCCPDCEMVFDVLRSMGKADAPIACPQCSGMEARRLLSRFAALSKGAGGESRSLAGSSGCGSCAATSCSGCSPR